MKLLDFFYVRSLFRVAAQEASPDNEWTKYLDQGDKQRLADAEWLRKGANTLVWLGVLS